jgi:hypothetical protein
VSQKSLGEHCRRQGPCLRPTQARALLLLGSVNPRPYWRPAGGRSVAGPAIAESTLCGCYLLQYSRVQSNLQEPATDNRTRGAHQTVNSLWLRAITALLLAPLAVSDAAGAPELPRPRLQIINGSSQAIDIFWLKSDTERANVSGDLRAMTIAVSGKPALFVNGRRKEARYAESRPVFGE